MTDDFSANTSTSERVAVGGTATGHIETSGDRNRFAVDPVAGWNHTIELRGSLMADGTFRDPCLGGIDDADGNQNSGTTNDDGCDGHNNRVTFTVTESGSN